MTVRSVDLLDLPLLRRCRREVLSLDHGRMLTRGNPLGAMALLSYLNPSRQLYTAVATEDGDALMGQVILKNEERSARLTFLAPEEGINGLALPLLDHLIKQAGSWGALHILAEVGEEAPVFKVLRQAGFAVYAWQRVWKLPRPKAKPAKNAWREAEDVDWPAVQALHGQIVPALLLPIENLPKEATGLVCRSEGDLQAYVGVDSGTQGIWLQPLVPPDSNCATEQMLGLMHILTSSSRLPIYVCVRSYQAWLEAVLEDLGAEAGERQAIMVKRLAMTIREMVNSPALEKALAKAKPAAPVTRISKPSAPDAGRDR